jgi:nitroreductase
MSFLKLARQRYSVRKYEDKPVETEKLVAILEAGRIAPSAANKQPCIFLVLKDGVSITKLGKACGAGPYGAPLAIIVCADKNIAWVRPYDGSSMVDIDSTVATDHMMMCAQDLGLSSCWITYFDPAVLVKEFNVPNNLVPVNILVIGYGIDKPMPSDRHAQTRKPLDSIVKYTTF